MVEESTCSGYGPHHSPARQLCSAHGSKASSAKRSCMLAKGADFMPTPPDSVANGVDLLGDRCGALELEVKLEGFVIVEHLPAMRALHLTIQLDPDLLESSVARHSLLADLHRL